MVDSSMLKRGQSLSPIESHLTNMHNNEKKKQKKSKSSDSTHGDDKPAEPMLIINGENGCSKEQGKSGIVLHFRGRRLIAETNVEVKEPSINDKENGDYHPHQVVHDPVAAVESDHHQVLKTEDESVPLPKPCWNLRPRTSTSIVKRLYIDDHQNFKFKGGANSTITTTHRDLIQDQNNNTSSAPDPPLESSSAPNTSNNIKNEIEKKNKKKKSYFSISLSPEEIEEDYLAMFGTKPPRRPIKRPRKIQNVLDDIFPAPTLKWRY